MSDLVTDPTLVSVCPRHPDREAYVRCQRCGRPACPDCQRPAAVGIQCVDCVKEGARSVRGSTTAFGGSVGTPGTTTKVIIGVTVAAYALQIVMPQLGATLAFAPSLALTEPWRMVSMTLVHAGVLHLAFNMLALWQLGPYLEMLLGRARFVALYLLSAVGGAAFVTLLSAGPYAVGGGVTDRLFPAWDGAVVGASGSVFGLFAALIVLNRHLGRQTIGAGMTLILNAALGIFIPQISWQGHVGGFLTGLAIAGLFTALKTPARRRLVWPALAALLVVLVVVVAVKTTVVTAGG